MLRHHYRKSLFRSLLIACSAMLILSSSLTNASAQSTARIISADEAVALALKKSKKLRLYRLNRQIAKKQLRSAGGVENPELRIRDISTKYFTDRFEEIQIALRWQPPRIGALSSDKQEAEVRLAERKERQKQYRVRLAMRVHKAYANVVKWKMLLALAKKRVTLEKERLAIVKEQVDLGRRSIIYFTKARMKHTESINNLDRTDEKLDNAKKKLENLIDAPYPFDVDDYTVFDEDFPLKTLRAIAFEYRPEIEVVTQKKKLAVYQRRFERFKQIPYFSLIELSYHYEAKETDWFELMVGLELPLFHWNIGNVQAAQLAEEKRELQSEAIHERIEEEVIEAYSRYQETLEDWIAIKKEANEMLSKTNEIVKEATKHKTLPGDEVYELRLMAVETNKMLEEKRNLLADVFYDLIESLGLENLQQAITLIQSATKKEPVE